MSIFVPPRVAAELAAKNLIQAILEHIACEPDPAKPGVTRDRVKPLTVDDLRDAFARLEVPTALRDQVMARLLRERLVRTDGTRVWVGDLSDLRAFLARENGLRLIGSAA